MTRDTETGSQRHRDTEINSLTERIIGCAIEVHRTLGSGLLESVYETAICIEMDAAGLSYTRQTQIPAYYKGKLLGHSESISSYKIRCLWRSRASNECSRSSRGSF